MRLKLARLRACRSPDSAAAGAPDLLATLKRVKRQLIERHVRPDDWRGLLAVALTLLPLGLLAWAAWRASTLSLGLTAAITLLASLFVLRAFVLRHECGHGSLLRSAGRKRGFGFDFGVISGMPQFAWSPRHQFHHVHNGDCNRYRGPLNIVTAAHARCDERAAVTPDPQGAQHPTGPARSLHVGHREPARGLGERQPRPAAPGGCRPHKPTRCVDRRAVAAGLKTPRWSSMQEYRHIGADHLVLLALWVLLAWQMGPLLFVGFYLAGCALASGAGLIRFTLQHHFEHACAHGSEGWDCDRGATEGTRFLVLPGWLNCFTVNIGHHHVQHLSARIPSYCLADCQLENPQLFSRVTRIRLAQVPAAVQCILCDSVAQRIASVAGHQAAPGPA